MNKVAKKEQVSFQCMIIVLFFVTNSVLINALQNY